MQVKKLQLMLLLIYSGKNKIEYLELFEEESQLKQMFEDVNIYLNKLLEINFMHLI